MKLKQKKIFMIFFYKDKDLFEVSNYPKDSMFYSLTNMNKIGKMKDKSEANLSFLD